jgi:hypothetical protein
MKIPKQTKDTTLQSKRVVPQFDREIDMTISSMSPDKWLFVDLETGDVWHRRENRFNQKADYREGLSFWRGATEQEIKELRKITPNIHYSTNQGTKKVEDMKTRIFIIAPNGYNEDDHIHHICRTNASGSILDIYGADEYEEIEDRLTLKEAINLAKKLGEKKPTVI